MVSSRANLTPPAYYDYRDSGRGVNLGRGVEISAILAGGNPKTELHESGRGVRYR